MVILTNTVVIDRKQVNIKAEENEYRKRIQ